MIPDVGTTIRMLRLAVAAGGQPDIWGGRSGSPCKEWLEILSIYESLGYSSFPRDPNYEKLRTLVGIGVDFGWRSFIAANRHLNLRWTIPIDAPTVSESVKRAQHILADFGLDAESVFHTSGMMTASEEAEKL